MRVGLRIGVRMPAYCTSGGKAMLADLDPAVVDALHSGGLPPSPGERIRDLVVLRRALETVRRDGFGFNQDESEPGVTAIGASVGLVDGHHVALAVALPSVRAGSGGVGALSAGLLRACRNARREVGSTDRTRRNGHQPTMADRNGS